MGWTSMYVGYVGNKNKWVKDFLVDEMKSDSFQPIDYSKKGNTVYMAIKNTKENIVFGLVVMISFENGEFAWKEIDETSGPVQTECPQRILKKLSPTDYEYAKKWREKCWEFHKKNKVNKYEHGQVLKFPREVSFTNGFKGDTFVLIKNGRKISFSPYREQENARGLWGSYRITKWRQMDPVILKTLSV